MGKVAAISLVLVVLAAALTVVTLPVHAESKTIVVPDDYPTIQQAVNQANPGETVYVKVGNYCGTVEITKPIALIGENNKSCNQ